MGTKLLRLRVYKAALASALVRQPTPQRLQKMGFWLLDYFVTSKSQSVGFGFGFIFVIQPKLQLQLRLCGLNKSRLQFGFVVLIGLKVQPPSPITFKNFWYSRLIGQAHFGPLSTRLHGKLCRIIIVVVIPIERFGAEKSFFWYTYNTDYRILSVKAAIL